MLKKSNAYLLGGGIGSLSAPALMIRDGGLPSGNIFILDRINKSSFAWSASYRFHLSHSPVQESDLNL
ncbi:MAG: oleate hydratase [Nostoc sp.]|uniref:oleate hydratase n=1 Tax=Nostoc sp. TaxID=1180 RepID=UPI002FFCA3A0